MEGGSKMAPLSINLGTHLGTHATHYVVGTQLVDE